MTGIWTVPAKIIISSAGVLLINYILSKFHVQIKVLLCEDTPTLIMRIFLILLVLLLWVTEDICSSDTLDFSRIKREDWEVDNLCCQCPSGYYFVNRSREASGRCPREFTPVKEKNSGGIYYSYQGKAKKCRSYEGIECRVPGFSNSKCMHCPKETPEGGIYIASKAMLLFSTLCIVVIYLVWNIGIRLFQKYVDIKPTKENQNWKTKTEKVENSEIRPEEIPEAQGRIENGHEVEVAAKDVPQEVPEEIPEAQGRIENEQILEFVAKDVSGEMRLPNAMYGVIRNNGKNWESFVVDRGIISESDLKKLKSKFGVTQDRMKVQILKLWKRQHSQMKGLEKEELLQLASDFVNRGLDIDVANLSFANVCQLVIILIPNDKWMRFVRLELTLTEKEIRSLRIKYSEFTEEQKYQMLKHALIGRQNLSDVK